MYTHPNFRELSHEKLKERLERIRSSRLLVAIEHKTIHDKKMAKIASKLSDQWEKLDERNVRNLARVDELIGKLEKDIQKQVEISHQLALAE